LQAANKKSGRNLDETNWIAQASSFLIKMRSQHRRGRAITTFHISGLTEVEFGRYDHSFGGLLDCSDRQQLSQIWESRSLKWYSSEKWPSPFSKINTRNRLS
jgi:hypothetical protein